MGIKVIVIPALARRVIYATTYAELPTTGLDAGDLGYAVDRNVLYRWSGNAWQAITISSRHGATADRGNAADYPESSLYQADDEEKLYMIINGVWVMVTQIPLTEEQINIYRDNSLIAIFNAVKATVADFQANAGTGTGSFPEKINNNNIGDYIVLKLNEYVEVNFGKKVGIKRFRIFGDAVEKNDGKLKLQIWDSDIAGYIDWKTNIPTVAGDVWTEFTTLDLRITTKVKLVCTTASTGNNRLREMEVIY